MLKQGGTRAPFLLLVATSIAMLAGRNRAPATAYNTAAAAPLRTIGSITDFDVRDDAVGICKAVMEGVAHGVKVIDITHQVTPFDIAEGARFLAGSAPYFAKDAVFVAVVDPGVGTSRKAIIARSRVGQFFVLPDNGLLTLVQTRDGIALAAPRQGGVRRASGFVQVGFPDK